MIEYRNFNIVRPNSEIPSVYFVKDISVKEDTKK